MRHEPIQRQPQDPGVHVESIDALPRLLRELGVDPAEVLQRAGLDPKLFDDPQRLISHADRGRLLEHCVASTGRRHFGLLLGQRGGLHSLGLVGLLAKYSPDVETALQSLVAYYHLHARGAVVGLSVDDGVAMLTYDVYQRHIEAIDQVGDAAVAYMANIVRALCGPGWEPIEIRLAHRRPADVRPYRRVLQAPVRFDAAENAVVFSSDWLARRLPAVDPELKRLLKEKLDSLEATHVDEFPEIIRGVLRTALVTDRGSASEVAALFSIHSRTLNRRLRASGTTFRDLANEIRFEIAGQMLRYSAVDIAQIAATLDYSDASGFTRAFRRWSGSTPAAWRARQARQS